MATLTENFRRRDPFFWSELAIIVAEGPLFSTSDYDFLSTPSAGVICEIRWPKVYDSAAWTGRR